MLISFTPTTEKKLLIAVNKLIAKSMSHNAISQMLKSAFPLYPPSSLPYATALLPHQFCRHTGKKLLLTQITISDTRPIAILPENPWKRDLLPAVKVFRTKQVTRSTASFLPPYKRKIAALRPGTKKKRRIGFASGINLHVIFTLSPVVGNILYRHNF